MNNIVQFSIPRSGSTFVTQIIKELFPENKIIKVHNYFEKKHTKVVATIRDFRDILVSSWRVLNDISFEEILAGRRPTHIELREELNRTIFYIKELYKMINYYGDNIFIIKYEDFYQDHSFLYDFLENCFEITIPEDLRENLSDKYSIERNRERADKYNTFKKWDDLGIHGKHVYKGKVGTWKEIIESCNHSLLNNALQDYLCEWDYKL